MKNYDDISDYLKIAAQRIFDARELLEQPTYEPHLRNANHRHLRTAVYLAGYSVECILKAYIINGCIKADKFDNAINELNITRAVKLDFTGSRAHNLYLLINTTDLTSYMDNDEVIKKQWGIVLSWTTDHRYNPALWVSKIDAKKFINAVDDIHQWINDKRKMK